MTGLTAILAALLTAGPQSGETVLKVDAGRVSHKISPWLYGACIEDVNHEIYGGLYSQMIFGESFQEPARTRPLAGFKAYGGEWRPRDEGLQAGAGDGPKLVAESPVVGDGEAGVEVFFPSEQGGNAGLIVKVDRPGKGADAFTGYEVSLETAGRLVLGRHRRNWELIRTVPCDVPAGSWISLVVRMKGTGIEVRVNGRSVLTYDDVDHPLAAGRVGLRTWQRPARFRNLWATSGGSVHKLPFKPEPQTEAGGAAADGISGMWGPVLRGTAKGNFAVEAVAPFAGLQSQRITFREGDGEVGVENRGLNRWGLNVVAGKPYEGYLWARAENPTTVYLALESRDGRGVLGETSVEVKEATWARYDFTLNPEAADPAGRFAVKLHRPGSVGLGHAFLQPGEWGRFKGLPDRKDVAEALIAQGLTVLRYGGSMVNHPEYRWKKMIGPRDRRPPGPGHWYPYSSNGWAIPDFLDFCEAAGFLAIPAVNMGESAQDMADFVEYVNGPAESLWGRRRAADGHTAPYRLRHVELGNEEAVNTAYWEKFRPIAEAMWAKDPQLILVVGDFAYHKVIDNPDHFEGGVAVNTLAAHRKILELARSRGREVWFDVHINTDHPPQPNGIRPEKSYIEQLTKIAPGANFKVVIFEYNSGNHAMKRALSNALATNEVERIGALLPVACSANGLQPDGQNDNGWDQGLLFLNPSRVWLQPPGFVTRMTRTASEPLLVASELQGPAGPLSVNAKRSEDGKTLVLQVVNPGGTARPVQVQVTGFTPRRAVSTVEQLAGDLEAANSADAPERVKPERSEWRHAMERGGAVYTFPAHSVTLIRFD